MVKVVVSVFDSVAAFYNAPWFSINDGTALRDFSNAVNDSDVLMSRNPADFVLYKLGTFDDSTGEFALLVPPVVLATAASLIQFGETPT